MPMPMPCIYDSIRDFDFDGVLGLYVDGEERKHTKNDFDPPRKHSRGVCVASLPISLCVYTHVPLAAVVGSR